jgi:hypothetical protein
MRPPAQAPLASFEAAADATSRAEAALRKGMEAKIAAAERAPSPNAAST